MKKNSFWDQFFNVAMLVLFAMNGWQSGRLAEDEVWLGALYHLGVAALFLAVFFVVNWKPRSKE